MTSNSGPRFGKYNHSGKFTCRETWLCQSMSHLHEEEVVHCWESGEIVAANALQHMICDSQCEMPILYA